MFKSIVFSVLTVMIVALLAVPVVLAEEDPVPTYTDGRLNAFDIDAPVAVFPYTELVCTCNEDGEWWGSDGNKLYQDKLMGYQLYGLVPGIEEEIKLIMVVDIAEITSAIAAAPGVDVMIAQSMGYTFNYSASGYLFVVAPNGYAYSWAFEV